MQRKEPIGSDGLDIELVAPRLAPPLRHNGLVTREPGRGAGEADHRAPGERAAAGRRAMAQSQKTDIDEPFSSELRTSILPRRASLAADERQRAERKLQREQLEQQRLQQAEQRRAEQQRQEQQRQAEQQRQEQQRRAEQQRQAELRQEPARAGRQEAKVAPRAQVAARVAPDPATPKPALVKAELPAPREADRRVEPAVHGQEQEVAPPSAESRRQELERGPGRRATPQRVAVDRRETARAVVRPANEPQVAELPSRSLTALVASVRQDLDQRRRSQELAVAEKRQREAAATQTLAELSAATRHAQLTGTGGSGEPRWGKEGSGGAGEVEGRGGKAGRPPLYGMKFYLSGRRVHSTRVVQPPEIVSVPPIRCKVPRLDITPATVRMLVGKSGKVSIAYLKYSSSSRHFDACALKHAGQMLFRAGTDEAGLPLDVWINVRVEPSTLTAGL
jgi:hypothetical protein